jgi:hypothetical protein
MSKAENEIPDVFKQFLNESDVLNRLPDEPKTYFGLLKGTLGLTTYREAREIYNPKDTESISPATATFCHVVMPIFTSISENERRTKSNSTVKAGAAAMLDGLSMVGAAGASVALINERGIAIGLVACIATRLVHMGTPSIYEGVKESFSRRSSIIFLRNQ